MHIDLRCILAEWVMSIVDDALEVLSFRIFHCSDRTGYFCLRTQMFLDPLRPANPQDATNSSPPGRLLGGLGAKICIQNCTKMIHFRTWCA